MLPVSAKSSELGVHSATAVHMPSHIVDVESIGNSAANRPGFDEDAGVVSFIQVGIVVAIIGDY